MKAELQQKEAISRVIQSLKGSKGHIVDNRPQAENINIIQRYNLSSRNLGTNLDPADFGDYTPEAHHIIPVEIVNGYFGDSDREEFGTYRNYDERWNGIYLPDTPKDQDNPESNRYGLPYHRYGEGAHSRYTVWVKSKLNSVNLASDDADEAKRVHTIAETIRNKITSMQDNSCLDDIAAYDDKKAARMSGGGDSASGGGFFRRNPSRGARFQGDYAE